MRGISLKIRNIITAAVSAAALLSVTALSGCSASDDIKTTKVFSTYGDIPLGEMSYVVNNKNITVTKYTQSLTGIVIPEEIDGKKVTEIGKNAFNNQYIAVAVLPDSVKKINEKAFAYAQEVYSNVSDNVEYASDSFATGVGLSGGFLDDGSVYFLDAQFLYEENENGEIIITGFSRSPITVEWPEELSSATEIGGHAFMNAALINAIDIPSSLTSIGDHAFYNCTGLNSINVTGNDGLYGTADLSMVNSLGDWSFGGCTQLTGVELCESLTEIGIGAFSRCTELSEINIPASVNNIGEYAFNSCSNLQNINVSADNRSYTDTDGVLFNKDLTEILKFPEGRTENYVIPDGVRVIGVTAFNNCADYQITIPKSVCIIENRAFKRSGDDDKPTQQVIPGSVTEMDTPIMSDMLTVDFPDLNSMVR